MGRIPLEDNLDDVLRKAQRGWGISDAELITRSAISKVDLADIRAGRVSVAVLRRMARHLKLGPNALEALADSAWYPDQPAFPHGFMVFNTLHGDTRVNSFLAWDGKTRLAAAFDTGADCEAMLDAIAASRLELRYIFITHTHPDHIADLPRLAAAAPKAEIWASELEPVGFPGARTFRENAHFHAGSLAIKTLSTWGHSPGMTTFYVTGLSWPIAVVGDSLFASSMGGSRTNFPDQYRNNVEKIMTLPRDTVLACGHGPLTTVAQEKRHNPFFAR